jgi:hypothetical protein
LPFFVEDKDLFLVDLQLNPFEVFGELPHLIAIAEYLFFWIELVSNDGVSAADEEVRIEDPSHTEHTTDADRGRLDVVIGSEVKSTQLSHEVHIVLNKQHKDRGIPKEFIVDNKHVVWKGLLVDPLKALIQYLNLAAFVSSIIDPHKVIDLIATSIYDSLDRNLIFKAG